MGIVFLLISLYHLHNCLYFLIISGLVIGLLHICTVRSVLRQLLLGKAQMASCQRSLYHHKIRYSVILSVPHLADYQAGSHRIDCKGCYGNLQDVGQKDVYKRQAVQCNVSDFNSSKEMLDGIVAKYGRLDILVNNAGITRDNLVMKMSEEDFDAVIQTNLKGVFNCIHHISRQMLKQRSGRIINISSVSGVLGNEMCIRDSIWG